MTLEDTLNTRSCGACELCSAINKLSLYEVSHAAYRDEDSCLMICETCQAQVEKKAELDSAHWRFLSDAIWSEIPGVQVIAWRMLNRLRSESWACGRFSHLAHLQRTILEHRTKARERSI